MILLLFCLNYSFEIYIHQNLLENMLEQCMTEIHKLSTSVEKTSQKRYT